MAEPLPRYAVGSVILSRFFGICSRAEGICRMEEVHYIELSDTLTRNQCVPYIKRIKTACLGKFLEEESKQH